MTNSVPSGQEACQFFFALQVASERQETPVYIPGWVGQTGRTLSRLQEVQSTPNLPAFPRISHGRTVGLQDI
jgi:hypothetical protein